MTKAKAEADPDSDTQDQSDGHDQRRRLPATDEDSEDKMEDDG